MKNYGLIVAAVLTFLISGCSGKPDASDLRPYLLKRMGNCKSISVANIKKLNGVDEGNSYVVHVSYDLIAQENFRNLPDYSDCVSVLGLLGFIANSNSESLITEFIYRRKKFVTVEDKIRMVQSERGWIVK